MQIVGVDAAHTSKEGQRIYKESVFLCLLNSRYRPTANSYFSDALKALCGRFNAEMGNYKGKHLKTAKNG